MGNLGFQEILLIGVVILVLLGGKKNLEFMRGIGKGIREFNDEKDKTPSSEQNSFTVFDKVIKLFRSRLNSSAYFYLRVITLHHGGG